MLNSSPFSPKKFLTQLIESMNSLTAQQDLQTFLSKFISKYKEQVREEILCDESLLIDLIKLENKTKKAFQTGMPLDDYTEFHYLRCSFG